jgi:hypothetical protein
MDIVPITTAEIRKCTLKPGQFVLVHDGTIVSTFKIAESENIFYVCSARKIMLLGTPDEFAKEIADKKLICSTEIMDKLPSIEAEVASTSLWSRFTRWFWTSSKETDNV